MSESQTKNVHEDLTVGDEEEGMPAAEPMAEGPEEYTWQRRSVDEKTGKESWESYTLRPYVRSVEDLWHRLCEADVPLPQRRLMQKNLDAYASCAVKLLFLLSHEPEAYASLRGDNARFLTAIDAWADVHVPRARTIEAVTLALKIHNQEMQKTCAALAANRHRAERTPR